MTIFITSDLHLGHKNILSYTDRHKYYKDIDEHDIEIIDTINKNVKAKDTLYILGDVSFNYPDKLFNELICNDIVIVPGNHDKWIDKPRKFTRINPASQQQITIDSEIIELSYNNSSFIMSHYPLARWNKGHYGSYMLHGHCHGSFNSENTKCRRLDVGWDNFYKPITLAEIIELKESVPVTTPHHDKDDNES